MINLELALMFLDVNLLSLTTSRGIAIEYPLHSCRSKFVSIFNDFVGSA